MDTLNKIAVHEINFENYEELAEQVGMRDRAEEFLAMAEYVQWADYEGGFIELMTRNGGIRDMPPALHWAGQECWEAVSKFNNAVQRYLDSLRIRW